MSTTPANPTSRPWRRFLRFSVRGMIVVMLVVGGWLGWIVRSARIQREAVAAIRKAGGGTSYRWISDRNVSVSRSSQWVPQWLIERVGPDYFDDVVQVEFTRERTAATDLEMRHIENLTKLERIRLYGVRASTAGLAKLERLGQLRILVMTGSSVPDTWMAHLRGLTRLESLDLLDCQITDAGLRHVALLSNLQELEVSMNAGVSDEGLTHVRSLKSLRKLFLSYTAVTDAGLANLEGLDKLQILYLTSTRITDAGLSHLEGMTGLTQLELSNCDITDAGIPHLKKLTRLKALMLMNTKVTDAGQKELQKALRGLKIHR